MCISSDRADWTVQRRLLLGALVCAVLLIVCYFVLVSTSLGHQLDDDAYFGHETLSRKVIRLDSDMLDLVTKAALLFTAVVMILIAAVRRCTFVGLVAVVGFGCAVVGSCLRGQTERPTKAGDCASRPRRVRKRGIGDCRRGRIVADRRRGGARIPTW
jgi:hypothetical protein